MRTHRCCCRLQFLSDKTQHLLEWGLSNSFQFLWPNVQSLIPGCFQQQEQTLYKMEAEGWSRWGRCGAGSCCSVPNRLSVLTELKGFRGKRWAEIERKGV